MVPASPTSMPYCDQPGVSCKSFASPPLFSARPLHGRSPSPGGFGACRTETAFANRRRERDRRPPAGRRGPGRREGAAEDHTTPKAPLPPSVE